MKVDPIQRALELRKTLKIDDKILVVEYTDTLQGKDTSKYIDLMPNIRTGEKVFRAKVNVKEIDPIVNADQKDKFIDIRNMSDIEIEKLINKGEFDFPLWFKHHKDFSMKRVLDYNPPFVFQVGGCNFHDGSPTGGCWYCFVDDASNDGVIAKGKTWLGVNDTIDSMISAREKVSKQYEAEGIDMKIKVLRASGGEPTLILDHTLNLWREIERRGLDFVGQLDSNLSTGYVVDKFEKEGIYEPNTLEKLAEFKRVKVLTALKGVCEENLQANVQSTATMEEQFHSLEKFLKAGFDIFPQMYNPYPRSLKEYLTVMDSRIENFSLRVHIGPLKIYGPTRKRLTLEAERQGIPAEEFIAMKKAEWDNNYHDGCAVLDDYLREVHKVGYREVTRSDVPLKILK
jgi:uncharacterized Fe-S cluster-containing radical SAM superfamily protein